MPLRVVFMGTPDFAVATLTEIVGHGHDVIAAYTRAPAPAGRGMALRPSPVHVTAGQFGIEVLHPTTLRTPEAAEAFRRHDADVAVVVAYGLLLPPAILDAPREGCLNLHGSLLPRWRGAAPIQRAVLAGDTQTGVCVMRMEEGLDTGPVAMCERITIDPDMTAGELHDRMAGLGADLMGRALGGLERGALTFTAQPPDGAIYARKIVNAECRLDFEAPAPALHNLARGLSPFPGAFMEIDVGKGPERVKVLRTQVVDGGGAAGTVLDDAMTVACGAGALRLLSVQRAGRGAASGPEFQRGARLEPGVMLRWIRA